MKKFIINAAVAALMVAVAVVAYYAESAHLDRMEVEIVGRVISH